MSLPDLIEIIPLDRPVRAQITVPGSKSITNRALVLAALADGPVTLKGALWSEDTQIMVDCLKELGIVVNVTPEAEEPCNRTILVVGGGGNIPPGGTESEPLDLFVGNAGTAARFLAPFLCLGSGVYRLHGVPRMHERPQAALFQALRELGYRIESEFDNDKLPVRIFSDDVLRAPESQTEFMQRRQVPPVPKQCRVSIAESSQFASALLLSAATGGWEVEIEGENAEESPYVVMTSRLMEVFPKKGGSFQIEPDASSGSYFWGAGWLIHGEDLRRAWQAEQELLAHPIKPGEFVQLRSFHDSDVTVLKWPDSHWQIDGDFTVFVRAGKANHPIEISRQHDLGDSIMTAMVLAPFATQPVKFTELARLRVQECERVMAIQAELTKCGANVVEEDDTLTITPALLHGAEIETYNDHRMAMCFAILGLKVPGIRIKNPACVKKTFPNFFQKLAGPPPHGLGAEIWEIKNGRRARKLGGDELFAE